MQPVRVDESDNLEEYQVTVRDDEREKRKENRKTNGKREKA